MLTSMRLVLLSALLACSSAHALLVNFNADPVDVSITQSYPGSMSSFEDTVLFSVTAPSGLVSTAFSNWPVQTAGLRMLELELFQGSTLLHSTGGSAVTPPSSGVPAFTLQSLSHALSVGDYRLVLSGDVRPDGGFYAWTVSTVPIPEPEQWALMIAGLALVLGGVARRRHPPQ